MKYRSFLHLLSTFVLLMVMGCQSQGMAEKSDMESDDLYTFNRAPLKAKPYTELPLGTIKPDGWLKDELERMADGMTGHLDEWYPEVCGSRNAWLGGDGDTWERGPYWIDGLYPLTYLLDDKDLQAKAKKWVEWTLENQREDGYIGPVEMKDEDRTVPPPRGAQIIEPDDWWPRMVMLKILQQHYLATGDERVIAVMSKYFKYQLKTLPDAPLKAPHGGKGGSWWAEQRGGDNLMSVLWLYNITGEEWLLELGDLLYKQTLPWTNLFLEGDALKRQTDQPGGPVFHCVNLAQGIKTPIVRFQQDQDQKHLEATRIAFNDIRNHQGQPHGLYGGDEYMHGPGLDRGSELCTAVEMMFSLEKMFEITGDVSFADRIEKIAFNALPTQVTDDHYARQYFQQSNQVECTWGDRSFDQDGGARVVYGLLHGYPCCTCNYHQGWPKFTQHLWMASADKGLAAMAYAPSSVTAKVADGQQVTITEETVYPFEETIRFTVKTDKPVAFPLHLRIPGWCEQAAITVNGKPGPKAETGKVAIVDHTWKSGDRVELKLPMQLRKSHWYQRSVAIERGPLVYALRLEENWSEVKHPAPEGVPAEAMHRGHRECRPTQDWNYALFEETLNNLNKEVKVVTKDSFAANPWNLENAPIELQMPAVKLSDWTLYRGSAGPVPRSPATRPRDGKVETIRLIPYGCTTLRVTGFPWINGAPD